MDGAIVIERVYTRDIQVPLDANDPDFICGWRSIPVPPSLDGLWVIFDCSKDNATGWRRIRLA